MELKKYLTPQEMEQMEKLMQKASEKSEKERRKVEQPFLSCQLQFKINKYTDEDNTKNQNGIREESGNKETIENLNGFGTYLIDLMDQFCDFCQRQGYCEKYSGYIGSEEMDEELPFDLTDDNDECSDGKEEWYRHYKAGQLLILFCLVDKGKLTPAEAAEYTGMTWTEAEKMLTDWQEAQKM